MKRSIITLIITLNITLLSANTWIDSYGTKVPFNNSYLTGFGMQKIEGNKSETMEAVKIQALSDLSSKVQVQVSSSMSEYVAEVGDSGSNSFSISNKSSTNLNIENAQFLIETVRGVVYALAYVKKLDIIEVANETVISELQTIIENVKNSETLVTNGREIEGVKKLISTLPHFSNIKSENSVIRSLRKFSDSSVYNKFNDHGIFEFKDIISLEQKILNQIDDIKNFKNSSFDSAIQKVVFLLEEQGCSANEILYPALTYQNTDFSSSFGQYASNKIKTSLNRNSSQNKQYNKLIIKGSYWVVDESIELLIDARLPGGDTVGSATVTFPTDTIPGNYDIKPDNHKQALVDLKEFKEGAITDGGIYIDFWTNKGKNEDVLIYQEDEELSLYFRVNQPSFLQITYILATGEKVLLEEAFYIGLDKVNLVVEYPYSFSVVPPLGVERLIVTAYSSTPPKVNVIPHVIEGSTYMVFSSVKDVVAQTRGLVKKRKNNTSSDVRTGEAQLAITTISR